VTPGRRARASKRRAKAPRAAKPSKAPKAAKPTKASSETHLRAILDSALHAVIGMDADGRIIYWNPSAERIFGWPEHEAIGQVLGELIVPPGYREAHTRGLREFFASGTGPILDRRIELSGLRRDGTEFPVELIVTALRIGASTTFNAFCTDLTERVRAEAEIRRYADIVANVPVGISVLRLDDLDDPSSFRIVARNPAIARLTGHADADAMGRRAYDLSPSPANLEILERFRNVVRGGVPCDLGEVAMRLSPHFEGIYDVKAVPLPDQSVGVMFLDVTARHDAEVAMRSSERRFRELFESAPIGIYQVTLEGEILAVNAELVHMLGYDSIEELKLRNFRDVYADPLVRDVQIHLHETEGHVMDLQLVWKRRDGSNLQIQLNGRSVRDEHGRTRYFEGFVRDITQRVHLEDQLRQAQKMEAVGRLAGGIAHDFNNLLTAIIGYSDLALADSRLGEWLRSYVDEIHQAAVRAAALTRQLLAFSRRQVLQPRVLDLNAEIRDTGDLLQRLIGADVRLVTRLDPGIGAVCADPGQLQQVLLNLAVNSRDAMPEDGTLTIETAPIDLVGHEFQPPSPGTSGTHVLLTVADTGVGMDEATMSRVFEPFFTTKDVGKGTGLGLSTAYGIIEQSGGHIHVQSQLGQGTKFSIDLPCVASVAEPAAVAATRASRAPGTGVILLAEDEPGVRELIRRILEAHGYAVLGATNAAEALALARAHPGPIRLLLTDLVMPGGKVIEMVAALRAERPGLPAVFMSGYSELPANRAAFELGEHFVQKPFTPDRLLAALTEALEGGAKHPTGTRTTHP